MFALGGAVFGFLAGIMGVVVYPGPLDLAAVGFALAFAIVASGSWFAWEWGRALAWTFYAFSVLTTTTWLLFFPPDDDLLGAASAGWTNAWMVACAVAVVAPVGIVGRRSRAHEDPSDS
ncbi:hypothetical protein INS90_08405 [Trueperella pecoris]|uniref:Uncharacterized protein n=1 Tax=Trueperella pecoris TaxID=2733571 RepID=A0A7M1R157_9ACTO|nr:hypothetical protein [Trueperella pecoris]QOR47275.1 hypothetical protein INS90_08405 [Trueperella pecoris]